MMKKELKPNEIDYYNVNTSQKRAFSQFKTKEELESFIVDCQNEEKSKKLSDDHRDLFAKEFNVGVHMFLRAINEPGMLINDWMRVEGYRLKSEGLK